MGEKKKEETFLYCIEKSIDVSFSINLLGKKNVTGV